MTIDGVLNIVVPVIMVIVLTVMIVWGIITKPSEPTNDTIVDINSIIPIEPPELVSIQNEGFGNALVVYFSCIAWYYVYGRDAHIVFNYPEGDPRSKLLSKLPTFIPFDQEIHDQLIRVPNIHKLVSNGYFRVSDWLFNRGILKCMIPVIKRLCAPFLENRADVVIHFRCADTPRNRHSDYMFQRYRWYNDALTIAAKSLGKDVKDLSVKILSCTSWNSSNEDLARQKILCGRVVNELKSHLLVKSKDIYCGSLEDDFITMLNAPCLISNGSSLSYIAGLISDQIMITPNYLHIEDTVYRDKWIMLHSHELRHRDVRNYDDIPAVIHKLKE